MHGRIWTHNILWQRGKQSFAVSGVGQFAFSLWTKFNMCLDNPQEKVFLLPVMGNEQEWIT